MKVVIVLINTLVLTASLHAAGKGEQIYRQHCAECHGKDGQGVKDKYDEPFAGDESLERLTTIIHKTMPEEEPEKVRDADARAVAGFVYEKFYSQRGRPRIELSRLTVRQFREAVADLFVPVLGEGRIDERRGLKSQWYAARRQDSKKRVRERIDREVSYQFGEKPPEEGKFKAHEFAVEWSGSIIAEDSGWYEFIVQSENGFQLKVNDMESPLIDGYVATGDPKSKRSGKIYLLGGRAYPLDLDWFKYKDKSASVQLRWRAPHREEEMIPSRFLYPDRVPPTIVTSQSFPPDDASVGYERGVSVSARWDEAVTYGALEVIGIVIEHVDPLTKSRASDQDRRDKVREFCRQFTARAFRRPLTERLRKSYVDRFFEQEKSTEVALKKSMLLTLKSPRFLYLGLNRDKPDAYAVAERLASGLWDSIPDQSLTVQAERKQFSNRNQIRSRAAQMIKNPRARAKLRAFFEHWLELERGDDLSKDPKLYPGFDKALVADLRSSLNQFLEEVIWKGDGDYRKLLLGNEILMNARMAKYYGGKHSGGGAFEKVVFPGNQRSGVLTHPYLLAQFAYPSTTSPIHRGVFVTRNMLGRSLKPPPDAIEFKDSEFDPNLTMREKVTKLTEPASCQNCHAVINPLGFSLENYDAVGRYRTKEKRKPINASAEYQTTSGRKVRLRGAQDLAKYAAHDPDAQKAFIEKLFHHVVKQPIRAYSDDLLDELHQKFVAGNYNIRELLVEIATAAAAHGVIK